MKQFIISLTSALILVLLPAGATNKDDISDYALFLTDKMAYELNLTEEQYEAAYEINYDYLYEILKYDDYDDVYGSAWNARNRDFAIILASSQYNRFCNLRYFYRPFKWHNNKISICIYDYYPRRDYLYFGCPHFTVTYRGGHGWRHFRNHSYYSRKRWNTNIYYGMRDGYRDGNRYYHHNSHHHGGYRHNRGHRYDRDCGHGFIHHDRCGESSTRTTVNNRNRKGFGNSRSRGTVNRGKRLPDNKFSPRGNKNNRSRRGNR